MKHDAGEDDGRTAVAAAGWAGLALDHTALDRLERYADWLVDEAIPAGGLGPDEANRVWRRHIADSLVFAAAWRGDVPPGRLVDVGSGAGLPGIPLAIGWPDTHVILLDRSGRRVELARRAVRILGLDTVEVRQGDATRLTDRWDGAVARAWSTPHVAVPILRRLVRPGGLAVLGLSHGSPVRPEIPTGCEGCELLAVPFDVLDSSAWLLMIHARDHESH